MKSEKKSAGGPTQLHPCGGAGSKTPLGARHWRPCHSAMVLYACTLASFESDFPYVLYGFLMIRYKKHLKNIAC